MKNRFHHEEHEEHEGSKRTTYPGSFTAEGAERAEKYRLCSLSFGPVVSMLSALWGALR
jgi:hypothetical protein